MPATPAAAAGRRPRTCAARPPSTILRRRAAASVPMRSNRLEQFLCGWYVYEAVLAALMAASAGGRTRLGRLGIAAAGPAPPRPLAHRGLGATQPAVFLAAKIAVPVVGILGLLFARRSDTRQIALLLAFSGSVPVVLSFVDIP
mgnify:CR=1 FL=1